MRPIRRPPPKTSIEAGADSSGSSLHAALQIRLRMVTPSYFLHIMALDLRVATHCVQA